MEGFSDLVELESIDLVQEHLDNFYKRNDSVKMTDLQDELDTAEKRIVDLEEELEEKDEEPATEFEIKCGIGTIEYNADNVQLQLLMEALEEQITGYGALKVLQNLQMPVNA